MRRKLDYMPCNMNFDGRSCMATGYEVCLGSADNLADLWNEYTDEEGNLYYGR